MGSLEELVATKVIVTDIKETLALVKCYNTELITTLKSFIVQAPESAGT
jgi:hypothetical protein